MRERASERAERYLEATSKSLKVFKIRRSRNPVQVSQTNYVLELARGYVRDAEYYLGKRKPVTALACIAYAEGLLDGLKFLKLAKF
jgi:FAD synthetase